MAISRREIDAALAKVPKNPTPADALRLQRELAAKNGGKPVPMRFNRTVERRTTEVTETTTVTRRGGKN